MTPSHAMDAEEAVVRAYYERGVERERLSDAGGELEYTRTIEILARRLPPPPALDSRTSAADPAGTPCGWRRSAIRSSIVT